MQFFQKYIFMSINKSILQIKIRFVLNSMIEMRKKIFVLAFVFAILMSIAIYFYVYKGHRDISAEDAQYEMTVADLHGQFSTNATVANQKYLDKTIEVRGAITNIDSSTHTIVLDEKLSAVLQDSTMIGLSIHKIVQVKGRFLGYDDLLEELKVDQASIADERQ